MALARVVSFEGVGDDRIADLRREITEGGPPEGMSPTEIIVLHDPAAGKALVTVFFETEDDYKRGDEILSAMSPDEVPGQRTAVSKYDVAVRRTM
jgi:hypothetical protein